MSLGKQWLAYCTTNQKEKKNKQQISKYLNVVYEICKRINETNIDTHNKLPCDYWHLIDNALLFTPIHTYLAESFSKIITTIESISQQKLIAKLPLHTKKSLHQPKSSVKSYNRKLLYQPEAFSCRGRAFEVIA